MTDILSDTSNLYSVVDSKDDSKDISLGSDMNRVTSLVRKQYLSYVQKLLKNNYDVWSRENRVSKSVSESWIENCAKKYEEKAVKSCMIIHLYRKAMLKIIAEIRRDTSCGKLVSKLMCVEKIEEKQHFFDVEVQTEQRADFIEYEKNLNLLRIHEMHHKCLSLQGKIQYFQQKLDVREKMIEKLKKSSERKHSFKSKLVNSIKSSNINENYKLNNASKHSKKTSKYNQTYDNLILFNKQNFQTTSVHIEDEIAKELETILGEEKNIEDEIFGDDTYNLQVEKILEEIQKSDLPDIGDDHLELSLKAIKENKITCNLRDSLWPCELHMREQKLRVILGELAEKGIRYYEKIRCRFVELFGEDSEEEFAPYSPTIEANEILIESCKKRIAPWIVKYLMIPMNDGLIGNRFLFKKLAKKLVHYIILDHKYPDETYVKQVVENFFCHKKIVDGIADLKDIYN